MDNIQGFSQPTQQTQPPLPTKKDIGRLRYLASDKNAINRHYYNYNKTSSELSRIQIIQHDMNLLFVVHDLVDHVMSRKEILDLAIDGLCTMFSKARSSYDYDTVGRYLYSYCVFNATYSKSYREFFLDSCKTFKVIFTPEENNVKVVKVDTNWSPVIHTEGYTY